MEVTAVWRSRRFGGHGGRLAMTVTAPRRARSGVVWILEPPRRRGPGSESVRGPAGASESLGRLKDRDRTAALGPCAAGIGPGTGAPVPPARPAFPARPAGRVTDSAGCRDDDSDGPGSEGGPGLGAWGAAGEGRWGRPSRDPGARLGLGRYSRPATRLKGAFRGQGTASCAGGERVVRGRGEGGERVVRGRGE